MNYQILCPTNCSQKLFIEVWKQAYDDYDQQLPSGPAEPFYQANVGKPLTSERIQRWFRWKNGTPLSPLKAKSIQRYSLPEERISKTVDSAALMSFLSKDGGAIWRIFWLHIQHPSEFPIYDQHVHRAMAYLQGWKDREIPLRNSAKLQLYLEEYRPFVRRFADHPHRDVDKALWMCGKFLKSKYRQMMQ